MQAMETTNGPRKKIFTSLVESGTRVPWQAQLSPTYAFIAMAYGTYGNGLAPPGVWAKHLDAGKARQAYSTKLGG
jgi:hypothetical protein